MTFSYLYTEITNRSAALNGTVFTFVTDAHSLYNLPPALHETITCSPHIILNRRDDNLEDHLLERTGL